MVSKQDRERREKSTRKQLSGLQGGKFVSLGPGSINKVAKNSGVGGAYRVKQIDSPTVQTVFQGLKGGCGIRLVFRIPVGISKAPEDRLIAALLGQGEALFAEFALREAVEGTGVAKLILYHLMQLHQVLLRLLNRDFRYVIVMVGVVAQNMPFVNHPLDQIRRGFDILAGQKEDGRNLFLFEDIQDHRSIPIFITLIKG